MNLTICYYKNDQFTIAERLVRQLLVYDRNPDIIELAKEILRNLGKNEEAEQLEMEYQPKEQKEQEQQQQQEQEEQRNDNNENENNNEGDEIVKKENEDNNSPQIEQESQPQQSN